MTTKTWYINRKKACDWLINNFPESIGKTMPLKAGIFDDIKEFAPALIWCRRALRLHTARFSYLRRITDGAERFDLHGKPCGVVSAKEALYAKDLLLEINKKVKRNKKQPQDSKETQKVMAELDVTKNAPGKANNDIKQRPILTLKKKPLTPA